ncbi:MAG: VCBS repeat-containing protein, partial [Saprospiraceae bacterium]|nr:VCBS repeat-containing protein [Saprospiraceae bacterium]
MNKLIPIFIAVVFFFFSCSQEDKPVSTNSSEVQLLQSLSSSETGLNFNNRIIETETTNAITFDGMLQGAGVAVLDVNKDGLQDIYFASNMEGDKLYLNKGDFSFEDITSKAGISPANWTTGVAVVDINNDGYDDIYVCKFLYDEAQKRQNVFYINNGDGTFTNQASQMGLADIGYSIMANFFDYDRDGDLDIYLANQPPNSLRLKSALKGKIDYRYTDKLYRNDNGRFTDVTESAGITNYNYSLSATTIDYNKDGWTDIYIASDYDEADFLYKNNGNGTFSNVADNALKHMSNFSMGVDIADINNDGHLDIYVADMVAEDNFRIKTNMSGMNPAKFFMLAENGYHYQYMFNALQLNNGDDTFSEIAQMSGVSNTDWSWTPLFIDFDNDGLKDLMVTNGLIKDMRNKDFEIWRKGFMKEKLEEASKSANKQLYVNPMEISNQAPSFKIANYVYRNNGDLSFEKHNEEWGFEEKTWSQGAAYADFDNDGDLDMVINNMNMEASLYRNMANENKLNNYITIKLEGPASNIDGINAIIEVDYDNDTQIYELSPYRGYMSASQKIAHFGLNKSEMIDEIRVTWHDNKMNVLQKIKANQNLVVKYSDATETKTRTNQKDALFADVNATINHVENVFDDYEREILLPYKTSTLGPVLAKADINGDGLEDLFLGGSVGESAQVLVNRSEGSFEKINNVAIQNDRKSEDGGAVFFDADNDGDNDLYVCSGGSEFKSGSAEYADRLYLNDGQGKFKRSGQNFGMNISTGSAVPLDIDNDGDLDLFVGGRQKPGEYGKRVDSYILENKDGQFSKLEDPSLDFLNEYGMVTHAVTADLNADGKKELIVAGEWMPVAVYEIGNKTLTEKTDQYKLENTKGWWNTFEVVDIDGDGDQDIIAGNLGHNIKYKASKEEPFKLYVDDFDRNGTNDVYLGFYENGQCFPVRGRQCSSEQMPFVKKKFKTYKDFGLATIESVLEDKISETTTVQEAQTFSNTLFLNNGNGQFEHITLPNEAQIAPVYG